MMSKQSPSTQLAKKPAMSKKVYSREFKLETLRLLKSSGKSKADLERELGLYPGQIHLWERAFNKEEGNVEQAFPGIGHQNDAEAELSRLRRELEIVRQERDILKKAIAIFSKTQDHD
jgi:transposase